jgi:hypothetical protein
VTGAILPGGRLPPFVPAEGRIDRRQLAALLRLLGAQMIRRGRDASSGMSGNPLLQTVYSMSFLGLMAAGGALRPAPLEVFLARVFTSALLVVALMITTDTDDVRMRRAEILFSKPVSGATHLAAIAGLLFVTASLVAGTFALFPLLAAVVWRGLPLVLVPLQLVMLVLGAFALVLGWVLMLRAGAHRFGADRVRMATQVSIVALIGLMAWSAMGATGMVTGPPALPGRVLDALPSTWLARFWTDDWSSLAANLRRMAVAALLGLSVVVFFRFGHRGGADAVFETTSSARPLRAPLLSRLLTWMGLQHGLRAVLPAPAAALAGCILTLGRREEAARLRGFVTTLLAIGVAAWGFWSEQALIPLAVLASVNVTIVLEGLAFTRQSASAAAAWAIAKSPLSPDHMVRGVLWAVLTRFGLIPLAMFTLLLFRHHAPALATILAVAGFLGARLILAAAMALRPAFPLDEPPTAPGALDQVVGWMVGTAGALGYVVAATLAELLGTAGLVMIAMGTATIGGLALVAQVLAARRLGRLEHTA